MASERFQVIRAKPADALELAQVFAKAFVYEPQPQAKYLAQLFPDVPSVHEWHAKQWAESMTKHEGVHFVKVVERSTGKVAGFAEWAGPDVHEGWPTDFVKEQNAELIKHLFNAMEEAHAALMGDRQHWSLNIACIVPEFYRQGAGSLLLDYGCKKADEAGIEAYVDASPIGAGLYKKYGFETKKTITMPAPYDFYVEHFMVRPAGKAA